MNFGQAASWDCRLTETNNCHVKYFLYKVKCKSSEKLNSLSIAYFPIPTALFSRAIFVADEAVFSRDAKSKYKILQTKNLKEQFFMTKKIQIFASHYAI